MKTFILLLASVSLFAASSPAPAVALPELPDKLLVSYWHGIAAHHAQVAVFNGSLTSQQRQTQESITAIDKEIETARAPMRAFCADQKATLDETGRDPVCKPNPEPPAK